MVSSHHVATMWKRLLKLGPVAAAVRIGQSFLRHDAMSLAAAVAFYTAFSFAPLVLLVVALGGVLGDSTQQSLLRVLDQELGPRAEEVSRAVVESAEQTRDKVLTLRWISGTVLLLVSASAVFGQLQSSLNVIWESPPPERAGVWAWIRKRLLSLGMVLASLFVLLVSLVLTSFAEQVVPSGETAGARAIGFGVSFLISLLLFAAIFRVLPDAHIPWRHVARGAATTALLFAVGKLALGYYLSESGVAQSYGGAAGAMVALLVWVYYSCIILFIGAEITRDGYRPPAPGGSAPTI